MFHVKADVTVGESYVVEVPDHLVSDHPLAAHEGDRFTITVIAVGATMGRQPAVAGLRRASLVMVELTKDQNLSLGLVPGGRYVIEGLLGDTTTGDVLDVPVPASEEIIVPVRWLCERRS